MIWIQEQADLEAELGRLHGHQTIAIDTEADSFHSYFDKVCLIQLTVGGRDVLIDPLQKLDLQKLGKILEDAAVTKLLHGADYDLRILGRDFGIRIRNLIDTMICAQLLGEPSIGLAALLEKYVGVELDKAHQRADWAKRPLPQDMCEYAMKDTRHLMELATILRAQLEAKGRWEWAVEEFQRLEEVRWTPSENEGEAWRRIKGSGRLDPRSMELLRVLYDWRDREARSRDVPPFRVISNDALMTIAKEKPRQRAGLSTVKGITPGLLRRYGAAILDAVHAGLATPDDDLPEKATAKNWRPDRRIERIVNSLKIVRNEIAKELEIDPSVLAPKHLLTSVATAEPKTLDDLRRIEPMRNWQVEVAGERFLKALQ